MINLENKLKLIFRKHKVVFAYLFGSRAKGKIGRLSDLDIAVYFEPSVSSEERQKMRFRIEEEVERKLNFPEKVDVIPLNDAQPLLEKEVVYNGKIIYCKDGAKKAHYEARAISRWLDWKYYEDKLNRAIIKEMGKPIESYVK